MRQEIGLKMRTLVLDRLSRNFVSPTVPMVCGLSLAFIACVYGSLEPQANDLDKLAALAEASPTANTQDVADTISMGMRASLEPEIAALPEEEAPVAPPKPAMKTAAAAPAPISAPALKVATLEAKPELRTETTVVPQHQAALEEQDAAPIPPRRPGKIAGLVNRAEEALARRLAHRDGDEAANAAIDNRNIFEKLFGANAAAPAEKQGPALAYAAPEAGGVTSIAKTTDSQQADAKVGSDRFTAVYDISAGAVYLPDGRKLEAHSGLGESFDNPSAVHTRMRGPTPPALYSLTPREALFHGVAALRLTPISGNVFGRAGLLAHTYMLGPRGDSNGCVSFRDYQAFLRAYQSGQVKRLAVVAHL